MLANNRFGYLDGLEFLGKKLSQRKKLTFDVYNCFSTFPQYAKLEKFLNLSYGNCLSGLVTKKKEFIH